MIPSAKCEALIKEYEQCRLKAYMPTSHDVPTIGWGSTGKDIYLGLVWTQLQADSRFTHDLTKFGIEVSAMITGVTTQNEFDALVSFAYNEGPGRLEGSHLLTYHNTGLHVRAEGQFALWKYQGKTVLNGLVKRRAEEADLYGSKV